MNEQMIIVKWPNGYVTEMRKSLAERHIKDKAVTPATAQELATYRGLTLPKPEKPVQAGGEGKKPEKPAETGTGEGGKK
jgi:hypothetical protein